MSDSPLQTRFSRADFMRRRFGRSQLSPGLVSSFPSSAHTTTRTNTSAFPLDPRRELLPQQRLELVKKHRFLRNATGLFRALCEKPVQFAVPGGLTPSSATGDRDFDLAADRYFDRWAMQPIDVSGQYSFYESQEMIGAETPCDGEMFALRVKGAARRCQLQFLKTHQVGNPIGMANDNTFRDGIKFDDFGRPLLYRVLKQNSPFGVIGYTDYSAEDVMQIADPLRFQTGHGIPWGYHGANSALDILDFRSLANVAEKLNLALAAVLKKTGARSGVIGPPIEASTIFASNPTNTSNSSGSDSPATQGQANGQVSWEQILGGGAIPVLSEGEDITFMDIKRRSDGFVPTAEFLIRDIAVGWGVSYEFIWNMASLGGPTSRFILEDLNAFLSRLQRILISRYCQPTRSWVIANGIIHGELPECKADNWWECNWSGPQKVTIDRGRDGKLYTQLLERGMLTLDEWWSMLGKDSRKMRRQRIDEIAEDMAYCMEKGIPYERYMSAQPGQQVSAVIDQEDDSEPDPAIISQIESAVEAAMMRRQRA